MTWSGKNWLGALCAMGICPACFEPGIYACGSEGSCDDGFCEPVGYCSYADTDCASGRRYSELAGEGLASSCVPGTGTTTTSSSSTSETTTIDPDSTGTGFGETGSGTTSAAVCGDGVQDASEGCDDGNVTPGDGCSETCVPSGTIVWELLLGDPFGGRDVAQDVAIIAPGDVVVTGSMQVGTDEHVAWYGRHQVDDGQQVWSETYDSVAPSDMGVGVIVNLSNDIIVGGTSGTVTKIESSWVRRVEPDGALAWEVIPPLETLESLTQNGGGAIVVGHGELPGDLGQGAIMVAVRENDGSQLWRRNGDPGSRFLSVASVAFNDVFLSASIEGDIVLMRGGPDELVENDRFMGPSGGLDEAQGVAASSDPLAVVLGGYVSTAHGHDWWLRMYDEAAAVEWTLSDTELPLALSDEIEDVVFAPDGGVYVTGLLTREDKDIWVAKFAADGTEVWSRLLPEDNVGDDVGRALTLALDGSLVVVGEQSATPGDRDVWMARLVP